jgi:uncharacterized protein YneF (UPF0154 family)
MKQWKTIISVILIFGLGALSGAIVTHKIYRQKMENIIRDEPKAMRELMVQRLNSKLHLDAAQLEQIRAIAKETHAEMKPVRKKIRPEIEEVLSRSQAKIRAVLRPDQVENMTGFYLNAGRDMKTKKMENSKSRILFLRW